MVVSSTLALDATHDVEWYVIDFVGSIFSDDLRFTSLSSGDAQDMYVLALVTQKGGSGKSTLAVGLAVAAMENGERVAFVEADPQGTISKWKARRDNPYPRVVRVAGPIVPARGLRDIIATNGNNLSGLADNHGTDLPR